MSYCQISYHFILSCWILCVSARINLSKNLRFDFKCLFFIVVWSVRLIEIKRLGFIIERFLWHERMSLSMRKILCVEKSYRLNIEDPDWQYSQGSGINWKRLFVLGKLARFFVRSLSITLKMRKKRMSAINIEFKIRMNK